MLDNKLYLEELEQEVLQAKEAANVTRSACEKGEVTFEDYLDDLEYYTQQFNFYVKTYKRSLVEK